MNHYATEIRAALAELETQPRTLAAERDHVKTWPAWHSKREWTPSDHQGPAALYWSADELRNQARTDSRHEQTTREKQERDARFDVLSALSDLYHRREYLAATSRRALCDYVCAFGISPQERSARLRTWRTRLFNALAELDVHNWEIPKKHPGRRNCYPPDLADLSSISATEWSRDIDDGRN